MKELKLREEDKTMAVADQAKHKVISSQMIHKGHTLFELNVRALIMFGTDPANRKNKESLVDIMDRFIKPVPLNNKSYQVIGGNHPGNITNKVIEKDGCMYESALNAKNAKKRFAARLKKHFNKP